MLHIYRQITSLHRVRPVVIAQKLENSERFPFSDIHVIKKPTFHFLRRLWFKQIVDRPWQISPAELRAIERVLNETKAQLLHVYFGHIAVLVNAREVFLRLHRRSVTVVLRRDRAGRRRWAPPGRPARRSSGTARGAARTAPVGFEAAASSRGS